MCKQAQGAEHAQADCLWIVRSLALVGQIGNHCGQPAVRCSVAYPPWLLPTVMLERVWVSLGHCLVEDGKDCGSPCNCTTSAVHRSVHTVEALIPQPCLCSLYRDEHKVVSRRVVGGDKNAAVHHQTLSTQNTLPIHTRNGYILILSV